MFTDESLAQMWNRLVIYCCCFASLFFVSVSVAVQAQSAEEKWYSFEEFERVYTGVFSPMQIRSMFVEYQIYQTAFVILELKLQAKEQYYLSKQLPDSLVERLVEAYRQANYPLLAQNGVAEQATFFGDSCTADCSGHFAGYEWAAVNNAEYFSDCYGPSPSFNKGCEMFLDGY